MIPFIYNNSPIPIQNLLISGREYFRHKKRYNSEFYEILDAFNRGNPNEVNITELTSFVKNAAKSPFWKRRFQEYEVNPVSKDIITELQKLPILTRYEVDQHFELLKVPLKEPTSYLATSGTTGKGLVFPQTASMERKQWAVWWRFRQRFGISFGDWMGLFGGRSVVPSNQNKPPYWRYNHPMRQVMFSPLHLNAKTISEYYNKLRNSNLKWIHGYPSQLAFLASLIREKGFPSLPMDYVSIGSESLLPHQIKIIEEVFEIKPIEHYGLKEGVANISLTPCGKYQIDQDFAFVEFIKSDLGANLFKIIGTNYSNHAFPLIRYDTNDIALLDNHGEIISIEGRNDDYITLPNGVKIGRLTMIFLTATFVKEAQFYQKSLNEVEIRIVPASEYKREVHEPIILNATRQRLGYEIDIKIRYYDKIYKPNSGKLKFVISEIR
ncbi:hypothetical protein [Robiginitalea aurantiaca]|uniref:Phenylacetate--CoA ligase family protein n=1 Tax=Robiginitalea aurantiaca TaxID=3056915 RepID=A0ABT7WE81_9FLAO|nr:hypothetical protein [Robiginitalea aurantiaca]MDM9631134.1 hypothetical protein [Robiginitalea aurantiaca]